MGVKELWLVCADLIWNYNSVLMDIQVLSSAADEWSLLEFASNEGFHVSDSEGGDGRASNLLKVGVNARYVIGILVGIAC